MSAYDDLDAVCNDLTQYQTHAHAGMIDRRTVGGRNRRKGSYRFRID